MFLLMLSCDKKLRSPYGATHVTWNTPVLHTVGSVRLPTTFGWGGETAALQREACTRDVCICSTEVDRVSITAPLLQPPLFAKLYYVYSYTDRNYMS